MTQRPKAYSYIRFSRPEQEKGDSYRRQNTLIQQAREYAEQKGFALDDSLRYTDRGLSGFHGTHRKKGALKVFLDKVEQGEVPRGSMLIVEALDRLSREAPLDALTQFIGIIKAGITLVTLQDGMEYTEQSVNTQYGQLQMSIMKMALAHEESRMKSQRLKTAWEYKRKQGRNGGKKMTSMCPAWLKPVYRQIDETRREVIGYEVIPEAQQVINQIVDMKLSGKGEDRIARELNQSNTWRHKDKRGNPLPWRKSYVMKITHNNRQLIGEQQFYKIAKDDSGRRKRIPDGAPVPNYYPPVIDRDKFFRLQAQIRENRNSRAMNAGRKDKCSNLFTHLAYCVKCGSPMKYLNKGKKPKGGQYLQCSKARLGDGCTNRTVRYDVIEERILNYCWELDVTSIMPDSHEKRTKINQLRERDQAINGQLSEIEQKLTNIYQAIEQGTNPTMLTQLEQRHSQLEADKNELLQEQQTLHTEIETLTNHEQEARQRLEDVKQLTEKLHTLQGDELVELRLSLRTQLRRLIRKITINQDNYTIIIEFKNGQRRGIFSREDGVRYRDANRNKRTHQKGG